MKLINEKSHHGVEDDVKCIVEEGNLRLTVVLGCDHNLHLSMDNSDESNIDYNKEFKMELDVPSNDEKLFGVFNQLYEDLSADRERYGSHIDKQVYIYSQAHEKDQVGNAEVSNYLVVTKYDDKINLSFRTQLPKDGFIQECGSSVHIPVTLLQSGSDYKIFNKMRLSLAKVIDEDTKEKRAKVFVPKKAS